MKTIVKKIILVAFALMPVFVFAHPGHGHESPLSLGHYVANPEHYIPLALTLGAALILLGIRFFFIRSRERNRDNP
jgi:amino acid transporter